MLTRSIRCGLALACLVSACGSRSNDDTPAGDAGALPTGSAAEPTRATDQSTNHPAQTSESSSDAGVGGANEPDESSGGAASSGAAGTGSDVPVERDASAPSDVNTDHAVDEEQTPILGNGDASVCERDISFSTLVLDEPPPFDVVIVADHSGSIAWSQDELSSGLASLLDRVHGRAARFFVLTPTQYGADAELFESTVGSLAIDYRDPVSNEPYFPAMTSYSQSCTNLDGSAVPCPVEGGPPYVFTLMASFDFHMPPAAAEITADMSGAEVLQQQDKLAQAVLNLGTNGSSYEQPLCTLGRYVSQAPEALPERAVILVLSDEDDESDPDECMTGFEVQRTPQAGGSCAGCDMERYTATSLGMREQLDYQCQKFDDMGQALEEPTPGIAMLGPYRVCSAADGPCNVEKTNIAIEACGAGRELVSCEYSCSEQPIVCQLDLLPTGSDACSSAFTNDSKEFANFPAYCKSRNGFDFADCSSTPVTTPGADEPQLTRSLMVPHALISGRGNSALTTSALVTYFRDKASTAFEPGHLFVETIVFDPAFDCVPEAGQSYAPLLSSIATSPEDVFPICEPYAPALQRVDDFAAALLRTEYPLLLDDDETLEAVRVIDLEGAARVLDASEYTYTVETARLTLAEAAITARDRDLEVEISLGCAAVH